MQRSYGGTGGFTYLFLQPAHLEIFPDTKCNLNGSLSSAIGGGVGGDLGEECVVLQCSNGEGEKSKAVTPNHSKVQSKENKDYQMDVFTTPVGIQ